MRLLLRTRAFYHCPRAESGAISGNKEQQTYCLKEDPCSIGFRGQQKASPNDSEYYQARAERKHWSPERSGNETKQRQAGAEVYDKIVWGGFAKTFREGNEKAR